MIWVIIISILVTCGVLSGLALNELSIEKNDTWKKHRHIDMPRTKRLQYMVLCIFIIVFCFVSMIALLIKSLSSIN